MARRLQKTLVDYMVIAISPALIMALVGSLSFFLVTAFYQGQYEARLQFILAMFVLAAVLIARISIEEGKEYAALFALPLAIVTGVAMLRFVEVQGPLAGIGWLVNWGLIALVWWCADRLTWDCTVIDEQQDASGEGLLKHAGLEGSPSDTTADGQDELEGTSFTRASAEPAGWWGRLVQQRRRAHAPGVWIIYFSLAALPLFGLGQWLIPATNVEARRYAFKLLCLYVTSGLGLLLTSSFLGLRRYLRQRKLEMPVEMAGVWLGAGSVMIMAVVLFCALLPRPSAEYPISQLPIQFSSPAHLLPSRFGFGSDGPEDKDQATRTRPSDERSGDGDGPSKANSTNRNQAGQPSENSQSPRRAKGSEGKSGDSNQGSGKAGGQEKGKAGGQEAGKAGGKNSGDKQTDAKGDAGDGGKAAGQSDTAQAKQDSMQGSAGSESPDQQQQQQQKQQRDPDRDDPNAQPGQKPPAQRSEVQRSGSPATRARNGSSSEQTDENPQRQPESRAESAKTPSSSGSSRSPAQNLRVAEFLSRMTSGMGMLLKLLFYAVLAVIAAYLLWRHWDRVKAAVRKLIAELQALWNRLFGGGEQGETDVAAAAALPRRRSISDFADPFATGMAQRWTVQQLVRYSFEALEAWGNDSGCVRRSEQTPLEFARRIGGCAPSLARDARLVAELYNRVAYAKDSLPPASKGQLEGFWRNIARTLPAAASLPARHSSSPESQTAS